MSEEPGQYSAMEEYLNIMQASRIVGVSDKTIRRAIRAGKLPAQHPKKNLTLVARSDLEAWRKPSESTVEQRLADLEQRLASIEAQLQQIPIGAYLTISKDLADFNRRLLHLERQLQPSPTERETAPAPRPAPKEPALPDDLISLASFAAQHAVNQQEAERLASTGVIRAQRGPWGAHRRRIAALDATGRRDFWMECRKMPGFRECADCPHMT